MDPIEEGRRNWTAHDCGPVEQVTTATALTRGQQVVTRRLSQQLAGFGLTFAQLEVLVRLADQQVPPTMGDLAAALRLHPTTTARTVARLERSRYVERIDDGHDRRITRVRVLARGLDVTRAALARLHENGFGLGGWDADDARRFTVLVSAILGG